MIEPLNTATALLLSELVGTEKNDCLYPNSIFLQLREIFEGENSNLDPSPKLNSILTNLVSFLQGGSYSHLGQFGLSFSDVEREVCGKIDEDESLLCKANFIRDLAMEAEFRLELHHVTQMLSGTLSDKEADPLEKLKAACLDFPYVDHYIDMVEKEAQIIRRFSFDGNVQGSPRTLDDSDEIGDWTKVIVFCGSGPLPLTGILMAMILRVRVILVDCDEDAVDLSTRLLRYWEEAQVIPSGVISVVCAKGEDLTFCNPSSASERSMDGRVVPCHVLFIAGLIANDVKEDMVRKIGELEDAGPVVVMRTAHGLTARFAYFQTRRHILTKYLNLIGIVAPETHRDGNGFVVDDHVRPIDFFSSNILNSLELYSWR